MLNSKFEYRNPKQFSNDQNPNDQNKTSFGHLNIRISDLFRNSDLGFRIFAFWFVILIFAFCILNFNCYAQPISSTELIERAKDYDGKTVTYQGEVVGEIMVRGDYAWVNVNDGQNAIGIWAEKDLIEPIVYKGDYKHMGDKIEIMGIFNRACPQHGGDLDIHAQEMIKVAEGREIKFILSEGKIKLAIYLGVALLCLLILRSLKQRR